MTCLMTDDLDLYYDIGLQRTNHALFTNHMINKHLPQHESWSRAEKIFVITSEGQGHDLLVNNNRAGLHVWDSVLDFTLHSYGFWLDHWVRVNIVSRELGLLSLLCDPLITLPKYRFEALLGKQRPHRQFVYERINKCEHRDKFLCNYHVNESWIDGTQQLDQNLLAQQNHCFSFLHSYNYQQMPLRTESDVDYILSQVIPYNIFNQVWFSILTETNPNTSFVTEKTAKVLAAGRVFVVFGSHGFLKAIKKLGFQTFESVIDESYDLEIVDEVRWNKAWQQVENLCVLDPCMVYTKCKDILIHNQKHFYKITQIHTWNAVLSQVKDLMH